MFSAYERLIQADVRIGQAANDVDDATQTLARVANRNATSLLPAPTAYRILGEIKSSAINLHEVLDAMPDSLRNTLNHPGIRVHDQVLFTGEVRDPDAQIQLASGHLTHAAALLHDLAHHLEAAQTALNSQSYEAVTPPAPNNALTLQPPEPHRRTRAARGRATGAPPRN